MSVQSTHKLKCSLILLCFLFETIVGGPTCASEHDSCTHPKVTKDFDIKWFKDSSPEDGWHMEIGNKVARLHIAELIQGKLLTYDEDFSNMCGRIKLEHGESVEKGVDGNYFGFGDNKVDFDCHSSKTEHGVIECDYSSSGLSKYAEHANNYVTYTDNKNVLVVVKCFPNGEVGWVSAARTTVLTEEERKTLLEHVKSIGFDPTDVVEMYNEKCPKAA